MGIGDDIVSVREFTLRALNTTASDYGLLPPISTLPLPILKFYLRELNPTQFHYLQNGIDGPPPDDLDHCTHPELAERLYTQLRHAHWLECEILRRRKLVGLLIQLGEQGQLPTTITRNKCPRCRRLSEVQLRSYNPSEMEYEEYEDEVYGDGNNVGAFVEGEDKDIVSTNFEQLDAIVTRIKAKMEQLHQVCLDTQRKRSEDKDGFERNPLVTPKLVKDTSNDHVADIGPGTL